MLQISIYQSGRETCQLNRTKEIQKEFWDHGIPLMKQSQLYYVLPLFLSRGWNILIRQIYRIQDGVSIRIHQFSLR